MHDTHADYRHLRQPRQSHQPRQLHRSRHIHSIIYSSSTIALLLTILFASISSSSSTSAIENIKEKSNTISLSVSTQCSFVTTNASLNNSYTATGGNGSEATFSDNGIHDFNVACNQFSGYTIKAYAEDLVNTEDASNTVAFYNYGEYDSRVENNSNVAIWSAQITSGGNDGASFGTSSETAQIIKSKDSASALEGDPFSVQYHAYIGRTTAPGVYEGQAVYTIAMNPYNPTTYMYTITYHANGITGTPAMQYGEATIGEDATVTLSTSTPTVAGNTFLGWDTDPTALNVVYTAGETITIPESNPNLNLYAIWSNTLWTVSYDANGGEGTPPTTQTISNVSAGGNATVTIPASSLTRDNYTFLGWSTNSSATTASYVEGDEITITSSNPNVTLYAVWHKNVVDLANGANMQDLTAASCATIPKYSVSGTTYQLVDSRDSHSYLVRKLEDGNCWMVQNLSLYAKTTITADDTDLNGTDTENNTFISNWNNATSVSAGSSTWTDNATKYQVYNGTYQANTKNTTVTSHNNTTANTGSYYPFIVATAGYSTAEGTNGQQAGNSSICPKGWKLPTGGSSGQFNTLYTTGYSSNSGNFQSAMNIDNAYPGYCYSGGCPGADSVIRLWSSTIQSGTIGYFLYAGSGGLSPTYNDVKYYGLSVRCVLLGS